jgi:sulfur carrier protein
MLTIYFNGEPFKVKHNTLPEVLTELAAPSMCAVAINGQFVPKDQHQNVILQEQDALDAFTPMQGG